MNKLKNKVLYQEGLKVYVVAENDRNAIKVTDEYLSICENKKGYFTTGKVKCKHFPAYEVEVYKP